jgi:hypothetical protein
MAWEIVDGGLLETGSQHDQQDAGEDDGGAGQGGEAG